MSEGLKPLTEKELEDWERWAGRSIEWKGEDVKRLLFSLREARSRVKLMDCAFLVAAHGSPLYDEILEFRREVLRRPLGIEFFPEELAAETHCIHTALTLDGRVIATLYLKHETPGAVRMKQVAVSPELQRKGYGRRLVEAAEALATELGAGEFVLDARAGAIPFYEALGYECYGEPFEQSTLPHRKMRKKLG